MLPNKEHSQELIEKRIGGVRAGITTSHWPTAFEPKKKPRWNRKGLQISLIYEPPELNENQLALVYGCSPSSVVEEMKI